MKELTIEQKAKAYDEALEKSKILYEQGTITESLCYVFPELKESEDERIRKALIFDYRGDGCLCTKEYRIDFKDIRAWLEKQGEQKLSDIDNKFLRMRETKPANIVEFLDRLTTVEQEFLWEHIEKVKKIDREEREQKPADKVEPKFKVGDVIEVKPMSCHDKVFKGEPFKIVDITEESYILDDGKAYNIKLQDGWKLSEHKDGDVLCYKDEISLYRHDIKNCTKQETTFGGFVYHCCYDGKRFVVDSLYSLTEQDKMDIHPATKEQRDLLFKKMHEAGYEWDAEKKELRKIEQKPWSEEDEEKLDRIITVIHCYTGTVQEENELKSWLKSLKDRVIPKSKQEWSEEDEVCYTSIMEHLKDSITYTSGRLTDWINNRVKSLRPQSTWKPSEEQMQALSNAGNSFRPFEEGHKVLWSLYKDLKKLREE